MKLRYYLRGLGVGILITAIIMGIASWGRQETLSDAQIRERALKMGMVDGSSPVLSDLKSGENLTGNRNPMGSDKEPADSTGSNASISPTEPTESTSPTKPTESTSPTKPTESTSPTKPAESTSPTKPAESTSPTKPTESTSPTKPTESTKPTVTIVIKGGSGSDAVSRTLAEAGLVADAKAYDQYLCDNGYSKGLRAGTYEIPEGASEEEIAEMIATKR